MNVHILDKWSAYPATQTSDVIKDGDVLVVPEVGVVGIMVKAWPCAIVGRGLTTVGFHSIEAGSPTWQEYTDSIAKAYDTARAIAAGESILAYTEDGEEQEGVVTGWTGAKL